MYRKLSYFFVAALVLGFSACSDQGDVVDQIIDDAKKGQLFSTSVDYTLTATDYSSISTAAAAAAANDEEKALADAVKNTNSLNSFATADKYVPALLGPKYPALGDGSAVQLTYNWSEGRPAYLASLAAAQTHAVTAGEYASVWGADAGITYFTPANSPAAKLPAILKTALPDAASGDVVIASYKYSDREPNLGGGGEISPVLLSENFEGYASASATTRWEENGWTQITTEGDGTKFWQVRIFNNNKYGQISANGGTDGITETWMVSPAIDLSKTTGNVFSFSVCVGYWNYNGLSVLITEDAAALTTPASVEWTDVTSNFTIPQEPTGGYGTIAPAGAMSLGAYAGKKIYIAFKYHGEKGTNTRTTTYQIDDILVASTKEILGETFEDAGYANNDSWNKNGWTQTITQGTKNWQVRSYNSNLYGQMSANGGADEISESYVVSPEIDLSKTTGNVFSFSVCVGYWNYKNLSVLISEDTAAPTTPAAVTWDDVTAGFLLPEAPTSGYGTLAPAGMMSLSKYAGKKIHVAFRYYGEKGTGNTWTSTYQIDNISVAGIPASAVSGALATRAVISTPVTQNSLYSYDGTAWALYPGAEILNPADYTAMGASGSLTADQAARMLPEYLSRNVEYAQDGAKTAVVYSTGSGNTADEYLFTGGKWTSSSAPTARTEQFVYGTGGWIFDPTINYTMVAADHQLVIDYMMADPTLVVFVNTNADRRNEEWYYGFSAYYNNISFRLSYREGDSNTAQFSAPDTELHALDGDTAAQVKLLWKRLVEEGMPLFASLKWPNAVGKMQGIDVPYKITAEVFYPDGVTYQSTSTDYFYTFTYKVIKDGTAGSPATFEYVSGAPAEYYTATAN